MAIASIVSALQDQILASPGKSLGLPVLLLPLLYVIWNEFIRASARVTGLKGPAGLPLIGNLAQIRFNAAEQYRVWSRTFGAVYQIQLGNIPIVVVNSAAAAKVLFGQNAQALSSRPDFYTFHKVGLHSSWAFLRLTLSRLSLILPVPLSARRRIASPSSAVERALPRHSTGPRWNRISPTSTWSRRLSLKSSFATEMAAEDPSTQCP